MLMKPGTIKTALAEDYIKTWADKVPSGTRMLMAKMKCAMADGPCGCPQDAFLFACPGPYPPVPIEFILGVLFPEDGSPCAVEGVTAEYLLAPKYVVADGHGHHVEFVGPHSMLTGGPAKVAYLTKAP
jgi:hypothetical protein